MLASLAMTIPDFLTGWVINACYVLDISCRFINKSLIYTSKFLLPVAFCAQPKDIEETTLGRRGTEHHRTSWMREVEGEGLQGALGDKDLLFLWQQVWHCKPNLYVVANLYSYIFLLLLSLCCCLCTAANCPFACHEHCESRQEAVRSSGIVSQWLTFSLQ